MVAQKEYAGVDLNQLFGSILPLLEQIPVVRAVIAIILVFFLPGFAWTLVFFKDINILERLAISIGLSIAIITLSMLVLNMVLGVRVTGVNALAVIAVNVVIPFGIYYFLRHRNRSLQE
ncbi:MAG: DUF1616 domain-containing protein [Dehalococcoidales bacterium]|nr:DUF1616 domain-containing protein [Dehalococcoidales bacterium]